MIRLDNKSWALLPFEKAAPHNDHDIVIFLSSKTAILLSNIRNFQGERYSIGKIMTSENHRDVFFTEEELAKMRGIDPAEVFTDKLKSFAYEMEQRLERYFVTNKMPRYIFFDEKEQDLMRIIFSSIPLFCEIHLLSKKSGSWKEIDFEKLSTDGYQNLRDMLGSIKLVAEIPVDSYLRLTGVRVRPKTDIDKVTSDRILSEYPELDVATMAEYKKAKRALQKSLHPDSGGDADKFKAFGDAIKQLESTKWFKDLEGVK